MMRLCGRGRRACHRRDATAFAAPTLAASSRPQILVKICGVTTVLDAQHAVHNGADFIGMIMWPKAKRSVDDDTAANISQCAINAGAASVGVFVDEPAETITQRARNANLTFVQLHGDGAREALPGLPDDLKVIYVLQCTPDGVVQTPAPSEVQDGDDIRRPEFLLLDGMQGGSGQALDWAAMKVPVHEATQGWLLAGGLSPDNVAKAAGSADPTGVDVSSGVALADGMNKDPNLIESFITEAKYGIYTT
eukprot:jgi/Ulvmu1/5579/UM023_0116.1